MHSRRLAAAFLTCLLAFAVTAYIVPQGFVRAEGGDSGKQCPAEKKNVQEYQPAKPWNTSYKEKRGDTVYTIKNLFGKPCKDVTNEEVVTGHCIREDTCKADKTAEGKKPQTCLETKECPPGSNVGNTEGGADENEELPYFDEPKPDNSDGVLPLKEDPKPGAEQLTFEEMWKPVETKPINPLQSLYETAQAIFNPPANPLTNSTMNGFGPQQMMQPVPDNGLPGSGGGQSLVQQAFNTDASGFGAEQAQPQQTAPAEKSWWQTAGEYVGAGVAKVGEYAGVAYDKIAETLGFSAEPVAKAEDTPVLEDFETQQKPEVKTADPDPFATRDDVDPPKQMTPEEVKSVEDRQLQDRLAQADRETAAYEKALREAENRVPIPDAADVDVQKSIRDQVLADEAAKVKGNDLPPTGLPDGAVPGRTPGSIAQEMDELKNNILDPMREEKIDPSNQRLKTLEDKLVEAANRADRFRDQNMVGMKDDKIQFRSQSDVDNYDKLVDDVKAAKANYDAEYKVNSDLKAEYKTWADEYKGLAEEYKNLPPEAKAFEGMQQAHTDALVKAYETSSEIDRLRAVRDDSTAPYTDRMAAAYRLQGLETEAKNLEQQAAAFENRSSCVYNCTFGKQLAEATMQDPATLTPEQQATRTGLLNAAQEWATAQRALSNPPDYSLVANEFGIVEQNPRAAEDLAAWQAERQADIDRANTRGEELAGIRERSAETKSYIDSMTGNQNPLLNAYQGYISGLKSVANFNLKDTAGTVAGWFTDDQQLINSAGDLGKNMQPAAMMHIGAGAGEQLLRAIGEPLPEQQLTNLFKSNEALAIQRTLDVAGTALNVAGFAPAGSIAAAERMAVSAMDRAGAILGREASIASIESRVGTAAEPTFTGFRASEIGLAQDNLAFRAESAARGFAADDVVAAAANDIKPFQANNYRPAEIAPAANDNALFASNDNFAPRGPGSGSRAAGSGGDDVVAAGRSTDGVASGFADGTVTSFADAQAARAAAAARAEVGTTFTEGNLALKSDPLAAQGARASAEVPAPFNANRFTTTDAALAKGNVANDNVLGGAGPRTTSPVTVTAPPQTTVPYGEFGYRAPPVTAPTWYQPPDTSLYSEVTPSGLLTPVNPASVPASVPSSVPANYPAAQPFTQPSYTPSAPPAVTPGIQPAPAPSKYVTPSEYIRRTYGDAAGRAADAAQAYGASPFDWANYMGVGGGVGGPKDSGSAPSTAYPQTKYTPTATVKPLVPNTAPKTIADQAVALLKEAGVLPVPIVETHPAQFPKELFDHETNVFYERLGDGRYLAQDFNAGSAYTMPASDIGELIAESRYRGNLEVAPGVFLKEPIAAESTFSAAIEKGLGIAPTAQALAERAGVTNGARPVATTRTINPDIMPEHIPLVEVKNVPGSRDLRSLDQPEALALREFNSSLANYSKALASGADVSRAAELVTNAYEELQIHGIFTDDAGNLYRKESPTYPIAIPVSPQMAAQAAYAVIVPVDPQVREFVTGSTDETFAFDVPDLRILSSNFGVQPPINSEEAIILQKANDILKLTRSRESLLYLFENNDALRVRPQDGFIVRRNGEVVARPEGVSAVPGALPERFVPSGPMPPLPVQLVKTETTPLSNGKTNEVYEAVDYSGRRIAGLEVTIDGAVATIENIRAYRPGQDGWTAHTNALGATTLRSLLSQFRAAHPEVAAIAGQRMSGARFAGVWDPADVGQPVEVGLPEVPAESIAATEDVPTPSTYQPARFTAFSPTALALGVALTVASPIPMNSIADAIGDGAQFLSTAAEARKVQVRPGKPSPREIAWHERALEEYVGEEIEGVASWYGTGSNSGTNPTNLTASGAWHRNDVFTVAMLGGADELPWGTVLLVKNNQEFLKNPVTGKRDVPNPNYEKEVRVVVTSTGSQANRDLDLSPAARDVLGIGEGGFIPVKYMIESIPDVSDIGYWKGRTDLDTGGGPVPKGTYDTRLAEVKGNPTIAVAAAKPFSGQPAVAGTQGKRSAVQTPNQSPISKVLGAIVKAAKSPNDRALEMVTSMEKANPNVSGLDKAIRLELEGLRDTEAFAAQRDLAARQIDGAGAASDDMIARVNGAITQAINNITANQSVANVLSQRGLVPKGSVAQRNTDGTYKITTPAGTSYKLAQSAPASTQRLTLDPIKRYTMGELRDMNAPELEKFIEAGKGIQNDRFITGDMLAINLDIINQFYNVFKTVPQINGIGRSAAVNRAVGGSEGSDHLTGNATDWKTVGVAEKQKAELLRLLQEKGLGLVTHVHGQGPHYHASLDRAATPVERANLNVTENKPIQYALTNGAGVNMGKSIALGPPPKIQTFDPSLAFVAPDLPSMIATNVTYTPQGTPNWQLPAPQVTVTVADSLEASPVPDVERGPALEEPLPTNVVVRGPDLEQPIPTGVVTRGPELAEPIPAGNVVRGADLPEPGPANPVARVDRGPDLAPPATAPANVPVAADRSLAGSPEPAGIPARTPQSPGPVESLGVNTRRPEFEASPAPSPVASNDNAPRQPNVVPLSPIPNNRALTAFSPEPISPLISDFQQPTLYANAQGGIWPTIDGAREALILDGEILPPSPIARSDTQVGQPKPVLDLKANTQTISPTRAPGSVAPADAQLTSPVKRLAYTGSNALGQPHVVINLDVLGNNGLVTMRSANGVTIPSVEEIESLLRQLLARHPDVTELGVGAIPNDKSLTVVRAPVNPLPALENVLMTGPTLFVNGRGEIWPSLASAEIDMGLREIVAHIRAENIIDTGIRATVAQIGAEKTIDTGIKQIASQIGAEKAIDQGVKNIASQVGAEKTIDDGIAQIAKQVGTQKKIDDAMKAIVSPELAIDDGIADIVSRIKPGEATQPARANTSVPSVPAPRLGESPVTPEQMLEQALRDYAAAPQSVQRVSAASPRSDVAMPPPLPGPTFAERAKNIWSDTKLATRIARGVVFPASTVRRNAAVNTLNMIVAYNLTGPYTVLTWPALNVGWRYVFNKDYRADVNNVVGRVRSALADSRAERAADSARQDLLMPDVPPTQRETNFGTTPTATQVRAPEVSLEEGIRNIVADIRASGPTPESIIDNGIAEIASNIPRIEYVPMPESSPVRSLTVLPLSKIDDLVAPQTPGTVRMYRGIGEAYDPTNTGPDPYFTPDYVEALDYAMKRAVPGSEPRLLIAEVDVTTLADIYATGEVGSAPTARPSGLTSNYIPLPKDWFNPLPGDPAVESMPPRAANTLEQTIGEFAADKPARAETDFWTNLKDWFGGGGGRGGGGIGGGSGDDSTTGGGIRAGLLSLARLIPGLSSLINSLPATAPQTIPAADKPLDGSPQNAGKPAVVTPPATTPPPKPNVVAPKPDTKAPVAPPPPAGPAARPVAPDTSARPGSVPTSQSAPTGGTNAGGMSGLSSLLSGLLKGLGLGQSKPIQPQQPQQKPNGGITVEITARPNPVASGESVLVTWTSVNATTCSAFNASSTKVATGAPGTMFSVSNVTAPTTYKVYCSNALGQYASATVQILLK